MRTWATCFSKSWVGKVTVQGAESSSELPFCRPAPDVAFPGSVFVMTGKFGPRAACQAETEQFGGVCKPDVTQETNYLVIGTFGSRDWKHSSFGRKVQKAVNLPGRRPGALDHQRRPLGGMHA